MSGAETALPRGGGGRDRDRSLGEGVARAETALPRGGGGKGRDCATSGRGWQGQRLCSLALTLIIAGLWGSTYF